MTTHLHKTTELGELVAIAFDHAARYSTDPREVSRLATQAVTRMLRHARRIAIPKRDGDAPGVGMKDAVGAMMAPNADR
jgi:hypothetical protein